MSVKKAVSLLGAALLMQGGAQAANDQPQIEPPPPPEVLQSGEALEPEVTIREEGAETVYEYRVAGKLVMVKVQPKGAPPYYFFDRDGDGELEYRTDDPRKGPTVNQWVLFRWW